MTPQHPGPLDGFRVGVTSDRRSEDLIAAFQRRGATVLHAPALTMTHNAADEPLLAETRAVIERRPQVVLVTTGYGMRRWLEVADAAGLGAELSDVLDGAKIFARGPKAHGAVRAAGLLDVETEGLDTTASLVDAVQRSGLGGGAVAVQLHGYTDEAQLDRLRALGAELLTVTPYRWTRPGAADQLPRLVQAVCAGQLDALTFTSAPAAAATLDCAESAGCREAFLAALGPRTAVAAVGPITAEPLLAAGLSVLVPERFRLGALIRLVAEELTERRVLRFSSDRGPIEIRGSRVLVGEHSVLLGPTARGLLAALARTEGVVSRQQLVEQLSDHTDEHALEVAVSRLRRSLGAPELIATVPKRGYRFTGVRPDARATR